MTAIATLPAPMSEVVGRKGQAELFTFGAANRRLFGTLHAEPVPARRCVLVCPAFGQEAIRLHRMLRVLAERLARQGIPTLRFDYFATGDSGGDDSEADFDGWVSDVLTAHDRLVARIGDLPVTWLGLGLGGSLAMAAAGKTLWPPDKLVLWEPVLDGPRYLAALREKHVATLEASFSLPDPAWRQALNNDSSAFTEEAMGFALPQRLRQGIEQIDADQLGSDLTCVVDVIGDPANTVVRDWTATLKQSRRNVFHPIVSDFEWTAERLRGSALVPAEALKRLVAACVEP